MATLRCRVVIAWRGFDPYGSTSGGTHGSGAAFSCASAFRAVVSSARRSSVAAADESSQP
jgi:hypothetical protein